MNTAASVSTRLSMLLSAALLALLTGCSTGSPEPPQLNLPPPPQIPPPNPPPNPPPTPPVEMTSLVRTWHLDRDVKVGDTTSRISISGTPAPVDDDGGIVDQKTVIGGLTVLPEGMTDPRAWVEVFSNETGMTYWAGAQAPISEQVDGTIGGAARLEQHQFFRKMTDDATLRYVITEIWVEALDNNNPGLEPGECAYPLANGRCDLVMSTALFVLGADADLDGNGTFERTLMQAQAASDLRGYHDHWTFDVYSYKNGDANWLDGAIGVEAVPSGIAGQWRGRTFRARLLTPLVVDIPLGDVPRLGTFRVMSVIFTDARTDRQKESYAAAFLRDPATSSGARVESSGIEAFEVPVSSVGPVAFTPQAPEPCSSSPAGEVEFDLTDAEVDEGSPLAWVAVRRTGGLQAAASVLVSSSSGSATAATDFESSAQRVYFGAGKDRAIALIPILQDTDMEPGETVALALSSPGGCVSVGARAAATLTIRDDDSPPPAPAAYRVGGNVSGLAGTGLTIEDRAQAISRPVTSNGAFEFDRDYSSGAAYDVRIVTQPANPLQVCSVANGSGTVTATVTDVQITCATPPPPTGLDPTFADAGRFAGGSGIIKALARQADGSLVYAAQTTLGRVSAAGVRDTAFGSAGTVPNVFGSATSPEVFDVAVQADGRILIAGAARPSGATGLGTDFALARFNTDGTRDTTFNGGNTLFVDFVGAPDRAARVLLQADGRIVLVGLATTVFGAGGDDTDFALVRVNTDGSLDGSFGSGGRVTADLEQIDFGQAAALEADGRIVVGGRVSRDRGDDSHAGFARFQSNGTLDTSFGTGGTIFIDTLGEVTDLALQADGRIVATIPQSTAGGDFEFGVLRLLTDGSRDAAFGVDGWVSRSIGPADDLPSAIAVQGDGRIVVFGTVVTGLLTADYSDFGMARFLADGSVDGTFGSGGALTVDFLTSRDSGNDLLIQPDGRLVGAGGAVESLLSTRSALIRVNP